MKSPTGVRLAFLGWPHQTSVQALQNQPNDLDLKKKKKQVKLTWDKEVLKLIREDILLDGKFLLRVMERVRWNFTGYLPLMHRQLS